MDRLARTIRAETAEPFEGEAGALLGDALGTAADLEFDSRSAWDTQHPEQAAAKNDVQGNK